MQRNNTFTKLTRCTPINSPSQQCEPGWTSAGYTNPGSCVISSVPGDGPSNSYRSFGYQTACKKTVPSSGDLAVDCCGNINNIAGSLECKNWRPYSDQCNTVMSNRCNSNVQKDPYAANWNGTPLSNNTSPVRSSCSGIVGSRSNNNNNNIIRGPYESQPPGKLDEHCINYLRNAPPNNFFNNHDFTDVGRYFPRYSYVTPAFFGEWGYFPMRKPYFAYNDYKQKYQNNYCLSQSGGQCDTRY